MEDYWKNFWNQDKILKLDNPQSQVGRTRFGETIEEEAWDETVKFLLEKLKLEPNHKVLDLCAGNGLITKEIVPFVEEVVAVDVSKKLLDSFVIADDKIKKDHSDILSYPYPSNYFDRVLFYFSAQHFDETEITKIFTRVYRTLSDGGIFYAGDIPDINKRWDFYHKAEYRNFLFNTLHEGNHHIGKWFDRDFLIYLGEHCGFSECKTIDQPSFMINSSHRFDLIFTK